MTNLYAHLDATLESVKRDNRSCRAINLFIFSLIVLNVLAVILESVESVHESYKVQFFVFEAFSVGIFTLEFLTRLWLSGNRIKDPESRRTARLSYIFSIEGIIDLAAIAPFYLSMFISIDLRFLRALRLVRIFKLTRYSPAMSLLLKAIHREHQAIKAAIFLLTIALVVAACGIYYCERNAQPDDFGSIPAAIWWAVATLTTVGYGDVTPITIGGKVFAVFVMILGVGMVALPTGILASTFGDELRRRREEFKDTAQMALQDGELSDRELGQLENVRAVNGLTEDEAKAILRKVSQQLSAAQLECPHCKRRLVER